MMSFSVLSFPRKRESRAPARAAKSGCPLSRASTDVSVIPPFERLTWLDRQIDRRNTACLPRSRSRHPSTASIRHPRYLERLRDGAQRPPRIRPAGPVTDIPTNGPWFARDDDRTEELAQEAHNSAHGSPNEYPHVSSIVGHKSATPSGHR